MKFWGLFFGRSIPLAVAFAGYSAAQMVVAVYAWLVVAGGVFNALQEQAEQDHEYTGLQKAANWAFWLALLAASIHQGWTWTAVAAGLAIVIPVTTPRKG